MERICESGRYLHKIHAVCPIDHLTRRYHNGERTAEVLDGLAMARVYSRNIGEYLTPPGIVDSITWNQVLDDLVVTRLGLYRCLECNKFGSLLECSCGSTLLEATIGIGEAV